MNTNRTRFIITITAILLGFASHFVSRYITEIFFRVGWLNTLPWIIAVLYIGYLSSNKKEIIINGALFGYFLFLAYMFFGYGGKPDIENISKMTFFALLFSLVGGIAGVVGAFIGNLLKRNFQINEDNHKK